MQFLYKSVDSYFHKILLISKLDCKKLSIKKVHQLGELS